jgi:membrane protease YdiL (CAAX protease family)
MAMRYIPHLITFTLIFIMPVWDYFESKRLKQSPEPRKRVQWYRKVILGSWLFAILAAVAAGWREVFFIGVRPGWMPMREGVRDFVAGLVAALIMVQVVALLKARGNEEVRAKLARALKAVYFILPVTREERVWFLFVSLTAGICEEILYRGFLIHYWMGAPAGLGVTLAMLVSSVIFGVGHIYQGVRGAISTSILGFVLAVLFVMTGSLAAPIFLHAVLDARVLLMVPEGLDLAPEAQN